LVAVAEILALLWAATHDDGFMGQGQQDLVSPASWVSLFAVVSTASVHPVPPRDLSSTLGSPLIVEL
jgi:hypothetical protein